MIRDEKDEVPPAGKNAFGLTAATNYGLLVIGAITGILAARLLGAEGRGALAAIQLWPMLFGSIALLGLPESLVFFSSRRSAEAGQALTTAMVLGALACVMVALVAYFAMPHLLSSQKAETVRTSRLYLIITVLSAASLPIHILRGRSLFRAWNALRLLPQLAWLAVLAGASIAGARSPIVLAKANIATGIVMCIPFLVVAKRSTTPPYVPRRELVRPLLRFGAPSMLTVLPQTLNLRLDQVLLAAALPARSLGLYVAAVGWSGAITPLLSAIGAVMFPRVAGEKDGDRLGLVLGRGVRVTVLIGMLTASALSVVTPAVLPVLFGAQFRSAVPAAVVLIIAAAVAGCNLVLGECLRGLGRPTAVLIAEVSGLLVTLISLILLLPLLGIMGAAVASLISYSASLAMLAVLTARTTGLPLRSLLLPTAPDVRFVIRGAFDGTNRLGNRLRAMVHKS